ncbi:MAG: arsenite methyltransferase [Chloroflexota bacterium]
MKKSEIRTMVRNQYGRIARQSRASCCGPSKTSCCGPLVPADISRKIGYTDDDLKAVPEGANLGLGCGNPVALASLKKGETVLDLGSGAGFDCFLASARVGPEGRIIGVDMTPEMLEKARGNARKGGYKNVEFRLGEIENLPAPDSSVDIVISNCVINLSPDKRRVFKEAFRVLKPGGRMMISDIVLLKPLPSAITKSIEAYVGCIAGADLKERYLEKIGDAGFTDIRVVEESVFPIDIAASDPSARTIMKDLKLSKQLLKPLANSVVSIKLTAVKPA